LQTDGNRWVNERQHEEEHVGSDAVSEITDSKTKTVTNGHPDRIGKGETLVFSKFCDGGSDWANRACYQEKRRSSHLPISSYELCLCFSIWHVLWKHDGEGATVSW